MKKIQTTWFVEPLDPVTNAAIAEFLTDTEIHYGKTCADGQPHDLWDCDYRFVARLLAATEWSKLKFRIFRRRGGGKIERWKFASKNKVRHPAGAT